jgi:hypothetical protein
MPRGGLVLLLLTLSLPIPAIGQTTQPSAAAAAESDAQRRLAKAIGVVKFAGEPFEEVIDRLRSESGLNIYVNWRALQYDRVTRQLPITIDLSKLTAAAALDRLLEHTGGDWARLGWTVDEGVITISSRRDLAKNVITRVYDVRKGIGKTADADARQEAVDRLVQRVQGIDPLSWRDAGGDVGSVRELSGQLIITQTPQIHQRIAEELREIENSDHPFPILSTKKVPER